MKNNKTCLCCGRKYSFCLRCAEYDHLPRWMNIWDTENCKNLYYISGDYQNGKITAEEAKEKFDQCDLGYKNELNKSLVSVINEVNRKAKKKKVIKQEEVVFEIISENLNEIPVIQDIPETIDFE